MTYLDQLYYQLPLLAMVGGGALLLLLEAFASGGGRRWLMHAALLVSGAALFATWIVWRRVSEFGPVALYDGMLLADKFSLFLCLVFIAATLLATLISADFFREHAILYGELYALLHFTTAGMMILAMAGDLVTVFLGIETMSLGAYVMTGAFRRQKRPSEAAMKYFLTGAFATGLLLYGIALVYGATGTTDLAAIQKSTAAQTQPIFLIGEMMLIAALGFKIAAVPFHMWAPDAYEGAPTPITGYMAAGIKAAGIAGILRVFLTGFGGDALPFGQLGWATVLSILSIASMVVGNVAALRQENVKRLLAYSSIAHAGYLLLGVVAAGIGGDAVDVPRSALLYYLMAYTFTTLGAFGVVAWVGRHGDERQLIDDWAGLSARHPAVALAMTIFLLSLGGIPPTGGFFGKFYVFRAAMEPDGQLLWLVVAGVLNSVVSVYYYLRIVVAMYFREPTRDAKPISSRSMGAAIGICAVVVLLMGVVPSSWFGLATSSTMLALPAGHP
jgi:NADH-quinone oxidoreductase subunit N